MILSLPFRLLLQLVDPFLQIYRHNVLWRDEVTELEVVHGLAARHARRGDRDAPASSDLVNSRLFIDFLPVWIAARSEPLQLWLPVCPETHG